MGSTQAAWETTSVWLFITMKNAAVDLKHTAAWEAIFPSHENVNIKALYSAKMKTKSQSRDIFIAWKFQNYISTQVILNITLYWLSFTFSIFVNIALSKKLTILMFFLWECGKKKPENILLCLEGTQFCVGQGKSFPGKFLSLNSVPEGCRSTTVFES